MKVIDLLNKIANGEELPEKIKYQDNIYYMVGNNDYENFECEEEPTLMYALGSTHHITDEVEIIEEDKKIKENKKIEKLDTRFVLEKDCENDNIQYANHNFKTIYNKINEIIDILNEMREDK